MHVPKPDAMLAIAIKPARVQHQFGYVITVPPKRLANPVLSTIIVEGNQPAPI
jgi:hypothetical protein